MSRSSRTTNSENPIDLYVSWLGSKGKIRIYDKQIKDDTEAERLDFIVLDRKFAITGYNPKTKENLYSNEVVSTKKEPFVILEGGKEITNGLYADIKDNLPPYAKFTQSIYGCNSDGSKLFALRLSGAGNSGWISFTNSSKGTPYEGKPEPNIYGEGVGIRLVGKSELKKNGSVQYYEPMFETFEISEEADKKAEMLDEQLQEYFSAKQAAYEERKSDFQKENELYESTQSNTPELAEADFEDSDDDLPF